MNPSRGLAILRQPRFTYRLVVDDLERGEHRVYRFGDLAPARSSYDVFVDCIDHAGLRARVSLVRVSREGPARLLATR